jgi:hypothetical protein
MRRLRKFLRLRAAERRLLITSTLLLCGVKVGLKLLPFQTLRRLLGKLSVSPSGSRDTREPCPVETVVWAVESAGRLVPRVSTCLTQALTAQLLLIHRGHPALIHIGAVRGEGGEFQAHAWVESRGEVLIGGHELERYTTLATLEGERR